MKKAIVGIVLSLALALSASGLPVQQEMAITAGPVGFASQCQAKTKKGAQCKRNAKAGAKYCWQHGGK